MGRRTDDRRWKAAEVKALSLSLQGLLALPSTMNEKLSKGCERRSPLTQFRGCFSSCKLGANDRVKESRKEKGHRCRRSARLPKRKVLCSRLLPAPTGAGTGHGTAWGRVICLFLPFVTKIRGPCLDWLEVEGPRGLFSKELGGVDTHSFPLGDLLTKIAFPITRCGRQ
ncbi:hypothetical protein LY76DRAFT_192505 [Colletotrichum caudatum]|nr:hypothetical protein LY76DRAFT_192505 [Colletotrichum caudatum]